VVRCNFDQFARVQVEVVSPRIGRGMLIAALEVIWGAANGFVLRFWKCRFGKILSDEKCADRPETLK
jgi:hypothetical protein